MRSVELICHKCGVEFIYRIRTHEKYPESYEHKEINFGRGNQEYPGLCYSCRKMLKQQKRKINDEKIKTVEKIKREKQILEFTEKLKHWNVVDYRKINLKNNTDCSGGDGVPEGRNLYIIGNGFDLMHCVKSGYRDFRNSLGKRCELKWVLENYLTDDDIWANFETSLAHINISGMADDYIVDMWLDNFDAYDPDCSAADFFAGIETAASPVITISRDLPPRFRKWVENLSVNTADRPLKNIFAGGKVLCFNYTEFVEELYGVPKNDVCYIHGCRRKKKGQPNENLILGYLPGAEEESFDEFSHTYKKEIKNRNRRPLIDIAQENVLGIIGNCSGNFTKDCREIIRKHRQFFESLKGTENIIVVGHSYSAVDWDYFKEIANNLSNRNKAKWYFGCYSSSDLDSLEKMLNELNIPKSNISVFRTDVIKTLPCSQIEKSEDKIKKPTYKRKCLSADNNWEVQTFGGLLQICSNKTVCYTVEFPCGVDKAFFTDDTAYLIVSIRGADCGVCIYRRQNFQWLFVGELESIQNQSLINPRLRHVFINGNEITFVYNSQFRVYSLDNAELLRRHREKYNPNRNFNGIDVKSRFF